MADRLQELREALVSAEREYQLARRISRYHDEIVCAARVMERAEDALADEERHVSMEKGTEIVDNMESAAREMGFESEADLHRHVCRVDISTPEKLFAFRMWQHQDGTKAGILKLLGEGPR